MKKIWDDDEDSVMKPSSLAQAIEKTSIGDFFLFVIAMSKQMSGYMPEPFVTIGKND